MTTTATHRKLNRDSVIYQIYPRSYQDSDDDGIGDLNGIATRLDHVLDLGVDGIWLSPIFQSPQADMGYDVSNYCAIAPEYGTTEDAENLIARAHELGLSVLFDIVPCHTSIEHPWFRDHPDWYIIRDTPERPNNWASMFGGPAWDRDPHGRGWYCHTFYPEQPNLNWRNPDVVEAMHDAMRFWLDRGVDGFRVDAIGCLFVDEQLRDNPPNTQPPFLNNHPDWAALEARYNTNLPEVFGALAGIRQAFPDAYFVAEAGAPLETLHRYTNHFDTTFCFQLMNASLDAVEIAGILARASEIPGIAWMVANHDLPRLASRWGAELARALAVLQLTLPGSAYIYQGDEIGMVDGPGRTPPHDRAGRDPYRHPMQWAADGDFSEGEPWLPLVNPAQCNVADQRHDEASMLSLYRRLLQLRKDVGGPLRDVQTEGQVLAFSRDHHTTVVNLGDADGPLLGEGEVLVSTHAITEPGRLPGRSAVILHNGA